MSEPQPDQLAIPLVYVGAETVPVLYANNFLLQWNEDDFFLVVGQLNPPMLLGDPDEQRKQAHEVENVPINVLGRFGMTRRTLEQLHDLIGRQLKTQSEGKAMKE